jgi:hypothetical protein
MHAAAEVRDATTEAATDARQEVVGDVGRGPASSTEFEP